MIIEWKIENIVYKKVYEGLDNVVDTVKWKVTAIDGNISKSTTGDIGIDYNPNTNFILFEDLTNEILLEWVWSIYDNFKEEKEKLVTDQVNLELTKNIFTVAFKRK